MSLREIDGIYIHVKDLFNLSSIIVLLSPIDLSHGFWLETEFHSHNQGPRTKDSMHDNLFVNLYTCLPFPLRNASYDTGASKVFATSS